MTFQIRNKILFEKSFENALSLWMSPLKGKGKNTKITSLVEDKLMKIH